MTGPFRLVGRNLGAPVRFTFDGRAYDGYEGDTLASALLAHGVHLVARSFKYHRPRGIMTAGSEEPNALVTIDRGAGRVTPNLRATTVELYDRLAARSQNAWPSVRFDAGAVAGLLSPLLPAGFYYKTFMWPASFWKRFYEPAIRAAAGLGLAPRLADPDRYLHRYAHCDVLVIGAGPAGLAAAKAASGRVILCDEGAAPGGSLLSRPDVTIDGMAAPDWIAAAVQGVRLLTRTTAFGWYPDNMIALAERVTDHLACPDPDLPRERLWLVRAKRVVIAAGAIERPMVFPGNDRPGIMLAGAADTFLHRHGVLTGRRAVVTTSHDSAWQTALALAAAGVAIPAILDRRAAVDPDLLDHARISGIPVYLGARVIGTGGWRRIRFVRTQGGPEVIPCDTVLMSDGWTPSVHLFSQSRDRLHYDTESGTFLPADFSAGACAGVFGLAAGLADGHRAGGGESRVFSVTPDTPFGSSAPPSPADTDGTAFVDFQNDVTTKDLAIAIGEGFRSIEHVKRYTTTGMATDQGKIGNLNALAAVASLTGRTVPEVGLTTFRPPFTPVTFGTFAGAARGDLFDPVRRTPIDDRDAVFEDVGTWKRAHYFPLAGETMAEAVARECHSVRTDLGLFDASTLGKIEVVGPDAAEFLNRMYTGGFARLAPGRCKYCVLLGEDGFIRDDGVIARLAPDRFHVTTTTGGAASVLHQMEDYLQTEFSSLHVWLTSTTEQWAVIAVQGPRAAEALAPFLTGIDLSAMPHMSVREGHFAGMPTRLFRVSFTGELGFEINVPAGFGRAAWDLLRDTGAVRYGTETMHVLRAEKGFIVIGQETDGTVIPDDLGLGWTIARGKPDFVGKRSLARPEMVRTDRKQLVGLLTSDPDFVLEEGAQITDGGKVSLGHVTSSYRSEILGRSIALAMVTGGRARAGQALRVPLAGGDVNVRVVEPMFYDRDGARMSQPIAIRDGLGQPHGIFRYGPARPSVRQEIVVPERIVVRQPSPSHHGPARPHGHQDKDRRENIFIAQLDRVMTWIQIINPDAHAARPGYLEAAEPLAGRLIDPDRPDNDDKAMVYRRRYAIRTSAPLAAPLRAADRDGYTALWLGPDEFLLFSAEKPYIPADSIVDVSDRTVSITVDGPHAALCINAFCALDLDGFPVGACTRTLFGKAEIILWRRDEAWFHIETARSFHPYVEACLAEAEREFRPRG